MTDTTIIDRIFAIMKEKRITQTEFADAVGVRQATVSDWKRGKSSPSAAFLGKIAIFLDVSTDYLINGKEYTPATSAVNQGIFGDRNENNTVTINGNGAVEVSEFEGELIKICAKLDMRRKNALLTFAYDLESQVNDNK